MRAPLHELRPRRRGAELLDLREKVKRRPFERAQLYQLHELGGAVIRQRARDERVDVPDVHLVPAHEVLQALGRVLVQEVPGQEPEEALDRGVDLRVRVSVLKLAVRLGRLLAEQALARGLEPSVESRELREP